MYYMTNTLFVKRLLEFFYKSQKEIQTIARRMLNYMTTTTP